MNSKLYTTGGAAEAVGITRVTLQAWIKKRKIRAPRHRIRHGVAMRLWTESDVSRLRQVKDKIYLKEMGRPKKKA